MPPVYVLTDRDKAIIQEAVRAFRSSFVNTTSRFPGGIIGVQDDDLLDSPEVYVAKVPSGGIPALSLTVGTANEDMPGSRACDIYQLLTKGSGVKYLSPVFFQRTVYNLSTDAIQGGTGRWILVVRDKYENWFATTSWTGAGDEDTGVIPGPAPCQFQNFYTYRYRCELQDALGPGTADDQYALYEYRTLHILDLDANGCLEHNTLGEERVGAVGCCDPSCADEDTGTTSGGVSTTGTGTSVIVSGCCPGGVPATLFLEGTFNDVFFGTTCDCNDFIMSVVYGTPAELLSGTVWAGSMELSCGLTIYIEISCVLTEEDQYAWTGSMALYLEGEYPSGTPCYTAPSASFDTAYDCDPLEFQLALGFTEDLANSCTDICNLPSTKIGVNIIGGG